MMAPAFELWPWLVVAILSVVFLLVFLLAIALFCPGPRDN